MMRYHLISGGAASWLAAKVDMAAHPTEQHRFLFADTLYEDADCYRFLIEGVAHLLGRNVSNILPRAEDFPDYRVHGDVEITTYAGNQEWRAYLAQLRADTAEAMPELIWLADGRDPWEVFRDERFLGNSKHDPCSKILKRGMLDRWRKDNADPLTDVLTVGIGTHEEHRYTRLAERVSADGWSYEAPLIGTPESEFVFGYLAAAGIAKPRLYLLNYVHNNCGGMCVKGGHKHYQNRHAVQPERFAYDAMMETKLSEFLGKVVTMLTDRSGDGVKKPLSLYQFGARLQRNPQIQFEYAPGTSGCGCVGV